MYKQNGDECMHECVCVRACTSLHSLQRAGKTEGEACVDTGEHTACCGHCKRHSILGRWNFRGRVIRNEAGNSAGHLAVMIIC